MSQSRYSPTVHPKPTGIGAPNPGGERRTTSSRLSSASRVSQTAAVSGLPWTEHGGCVKRSVSGTILAVQQASSRRRTQRERRAETEHRVLEAAIGLVADGGLRAVTLRRSGPRRRRQPRHREPPLRLAPGAPRRAGARDPGPLRPAACDGVRPRAGARARRRLPRRARRAPPRRAGVPRPLGGGDRLRRRVAAGVRGARRELPAPAWPTPLRAGVADGSIRRDADPDASAVALVALLRGVATAAPPDAGGDRPSPPCAGRRRRCLAAACAAKHHVY